MQKEIGSEFWDIPHQKYNNLFSDDIKWFASGRSALKAIIKDSNIKSVSIPNWCCESIIVPFIESSIDVFFYNPFEEIKEISTEALMVMDYFGYEMKCDLSNYNGIIIRDLTHSLLVKEYEDSNYYFGSLRKIAGFWTGGYAKGFKYPVQYDNDSNLDTYVSLRKRAMEEKSSYISNGLCSSKDYLRLFNNAEELLEKFGVLPSNERDVIFAKTMDDKLIKHRRRENATVLLEELSTGAIFKSVEKNDCPMFVPILTRNRNALRSFLIDNDIYCPIHWPISEYHNLDDSMKTFYDEELSLICDQRYSVDDMRRIIGVIKMFEGL